MNRLRILLNTKAEHNGSGRGEEQKQLEEAKRKKKELLERLVALGLEADVIVRRY